MSKKLTDKDYVSQMAGSNSIFGNFGGQVGQITLDNFRNALNANDEQVLNNLAFYIDVNKASSKGSTRVDVGGNLGMIDTLFGMRQGVLMNENGQYVPLNRDDHRYTEDGTLIYDESTGKLLSAYEHLDMMMILPKYYGRVQLVSTGSSTIERSWFSLVPIPGGYEIPKQVVGIYKATNVSSAMRSLPGYVNDNSESTNAFWNLAQVRSNNHGLANCDFRDWLLFYMMATYGWRDCQNCKTSDGTLVWGVGLDGTESTASGESTNTVGFTRQQNIKHGACISLGINDGKAAVTDSIGNTCHSVNVAGFENPWGQRWEIVQGYCAVDTTVYRWRHNWMPSTDSSITVSGSSQAYVSSAVFDNVEHVELTRPTSSGYRMNIISGKDGQGTYMFQHSTLNGVSYGDSYGYSSNGQLVLFGGRSYAGASCGLAYVYSYYAWSIAYSDFSARLAYYGGTERVTLKQLLK